MEEDEFKMKQASQAPPSTTQPPLPRDPPTHDWPPAITPKIEQDEDVTDTASEDGTTKHIVLRPKIMCRQFIRGICTYGERCMYLHEVIVGQLPDVYTFCRDYQNSICLFEDNCKFVHATIFEKEHFYRTGYLPPHTRAHLNSALRRKLYPVPPPQEPVHLKPEVQPEPHPVPPPHVPAHLKSEVQREYYLGPPMHELEHLKVEVQREYHLGPPPQMQAHLKPEVERERYPGPPPHVQTHLQPEVQRERYPDPLPHELAYLKSEVQRERYPGLSQHVLAHLKPEAQRECYLGLQPHEVAQPEVQHERYSTQPPPSYPLQEEVAAALAMFVDAKPTAPDQSLRDFDEIRHRCLNNATHEIRSQINELDEKTEVLVKKNEKLQTLLLWLFDCPPNAGPESSILYNLTARQQKEHALHEQLLNWLVAGKRHALASWLV